MKNPKTRKAGRVQKIIAPAHASVPEKAEIAVEGADDLYREIRIDNILEDEKGREVKLKEGAKVDVVVEADSEATVLRSSDQKPEAVRMRKSKEK
jgi:2',3'-cyclic-nucleotide 2'-phosphodiesterase (5'-nucleotidase family)